LLQVDGDEVGESQCPSRPARTFTATSFIIDHTDGHRYGGGGSLLRPARLPSWSVCCNHGSLLQREAVSDDYVEGRRVVRQRRSVSLIRNIWAELCRLSPGRRNIGQIIPGETLCSRQPTSARASASRPEHAVGQFASCAVRHDDERCLGATFLGLAEHERLPCETFDVRMSPVVVLG
jgi:hypothetical protein